MNIHITRLTYVRSGPKKKKSRPRHSFNDVTDHVYVHYTTKFSGQMADMLSVMIYDLCCSKTLPWAIFELGDDRMSFREFIIATCVGIPLQ